MRKIINHIKCFFLTHDMEVIPKELKDGVKPTATLLALGAMLGLVRCKRCGSEWNP